MAKKKNQVITVSGNDVTIATIKDEEYISLTDIDAAFDGKGSHIENWMRNRNTVEFLGVWESVHNPDFNSVGFDGIFSQTGLNRFKLSVKKWVAATNAIGLQARAGRYGGTYAHPDLAFNFAFWISPKFQVYAAKEFKRLKEEEAKQRHLQWDYRRFLSKVNHRLHTDTIRDYILPKLQTPKDREWLVYANEADLLNLAVFGLTAQQWRDENPDMAKTGNIRDHADIVQLNVLANLESLNSVMIERGTSKEKRFDLLSQTAISQYKRLIEHKDLGLLGEGGEGGEG